MAKVVYIEPGQSLEIRLVPSDFDKSAKGWQESAVRPGKMLIRVFDSNNLAFADHACRVVDWRG